MDSTEQVWVQICYLS